jgi:ferrous iron transport protein B
MSDPASRKIALIGNPNVGKSSVFNLLTGLRQKTGNFPGVTVDKKTGTIQLEKSGLVEVVDMPGLYSLYPSSEDEKVVVRTLLNPSDTCYPEVVVCIADATDMERNLLLCTQLSDLGFPTVLAVNMLDIAKKEGIHVDTTTISQLSGIPVVAINGRTGEGMDNLLKSIDLQLQHKEIARPFYMITEQEKKISNEVAEITGCGHPYQALLTAHHYKGLQHFSEEQKIMIAESLKSHAFNSLSVQLDEMMSRYRLIGPVVQKAVTFQPVNDGGMGARFDKIATHPVAGLILFVVLMFVVFQSIFTWSEWPMAQIETGFGYLASWLSSRLPDSWLSNLLTEGVISGLSGVMVFIPQIAVLFLLISLLEESGYMARVVYLMDNLMRRFGLNGRSVVSLISGGACAVPAIMSTRTIGNWKERLITIMVTPLISCSARIPVFTMLIAITIPPVKWGGWLSLQGLVFLGLYAAGAVAALFSAWVFSKIIKTDEHSFLMMELPRYQVPQWKNVLLTVYEKIKTFVLEAGKIILLVSMILWGLASYGPPGAMKEARQSAASAYAISKEIPLEQLEAAYMLEASFAGILGKVIEPVISPLGYDWKIGIALITSFAAREVFIGTMATIYAVGAADDTLLLRERMQQAKHTISGEKVFTPATALSLITFYLFAMQCMSTLAVVKRETKSWKWPAIQLMYMSGLAYFCSWLVYVLLK